jgi:NADPH:quinone reductase-like Zn-dependent oxidoreductase
VQAIPLDLNDLERINGGNMMVRPELPYSPGMEGMAPLMKKGMGWNFVSDRLGEKMNREIIDLVRSHEVRPVVGRVVPFEELPEAIEAMAHRESVGRTIVKLWEE